MGLRAYVWGVSPCMMLDKLMAYALFWHIFTMFERSMIH